MSEHGAQGAEAPAVERRPAIVAIDDDPVVTIPLHQPARSDQ